MENNVDNRKFLISRLRFYTAQIDASRLTQGENYDELLGLCQICFCTYDPYPERSRAFYHFVSHCPDLSTDPTVSQDGVHRLIFYTKAKYGLKALTPDMRALFKLINDNDPGQNELCHEILKEINEIKRNERNREMFIERTLEYNEDMRRAEKKGIAEGITQGIAQGITQGIAQGITQGIAQGITKGEGMLQKLISAMKDAGKSSDFIVQETADSAKLPGLYKEYGVT
ncbi:MAG: hypothetical protein IJ228_08535, partial [Succinivibrio sp.]|nr:hypothetical protein [Succinivibrio sp.]